MRWYIKPPFDGIFTQQYLYQTLLESDNYCWNYRVGAWVVSFFETQCILAMRTTYCMSLATVDISPCKHDQRQTVAFDTALLTWTNIKGQKMNLNVLVLFQVWIFEIHLTSITLTLLNLTQTLLTLIYQPPHIFSSPLVSHTSPNATLTSPHAHILSNAPQ